MDGGSPRPSSSPSIRADCPKATRSAARRPGPRLLTRQPRSSSTSPPGSRLLAKRLSRRSGRRPWGHTPCQPGGTDENRGCPNPSARPETWHEIAGPGPPRPRGRPSLSAGTESATRSAARRPGPRNLTWQPRSSNTSPPGEDSRESGGHKPRGRAPRSRRLATWRTESRAHNSKLESTACSIDGLETKISKTSENPKFRARLTCCMRILNLVGFASGGQATRDASPGLSPGAPFRSPRG